MLGVLVLPTGGGLRWLFALLGVPVVMYWVSLPPVLLLAWLRVFLLVRVSWVAFGLGAFGGAAGVGVAVIGSGCELGRGWWFGVAGRGPSPLLAEGLSCGAACWSTRLC